MSEYILLLIFSLIFLAIGIFAGRYLQQLKTRSSEGALKERENQLRHAIAELQNTLSREAGLKETMRKEKEALAIQLSKKESDMEHLFQKNREQKEEVEQLQQKFTKEFENLANKILDEKSAKFTLQNKENIKTILHPLQEKIQLFERKVEDSQKESISMHAALKEQLLHLQHQNIKISQEAENLTKALKGDSKTQGNWGELVLERILEKSGLEKGIAYEVQQSFQREDGSRTLPDVVIHLPDNKKMIIDAKVSLTAYERYINAEDEEKELHLKAHIHSIKRHVEQLSEKKYEDLYEMESPDFILMFVPIEPAFAIAANSDNTLYNNAFEKNIVIVTPSILLATLRTVDTMWTNKKKQENAFEIARQAGALYDKFEGFVSDLIGVGKKMDHAKEEYQNAMNKLTEGKGNLIRRVENLKKLGITTKKALPEAVLKRAEKEEEIS